MEYTILGQEYANKLRSDFIDKFTDKALPFYKKTLRLHNYYDGMCYNGYIWEVMKPTCIVNRNTALTLLEQKNSVYVMWDIRTMKNVGQRFHYKVPKDMVIKIEGNILAEQLRKDFSPLSKEVSFLPEDIYIFDDSFEWYIVFTHEIDPRTDNLPMCFIHTQE